MKQLLDAKASVNAGASGLDRKLTPLMLAAACPRHEFCGTLLELGALKELRDEAGRRALHYAAKQGQGATLTALLNARARVDEPDNDGLTPLLLASTAGRT